MRKIAAVAFLLATAVLIPHPCFLQAGAARAWIAQRGGAITSPTGQILLSSGASTASLADRYFPIGIYWTAFVANPNGFLFPVSGTLSSIRFKANTPPTGAQTLTAMVQVNGVDSALTCTVTTASSPAGVCTGVTNVAVTAGQYIGLKVHPTNSSPVSVISSSIVFTPTVPNDSILPAMAIGAAFSTSATQVLYPFTGSGPAAIASRRSAVVPGSGTIDKLAVASVAPGTGGSGKAYDYTMVKTNSAQALTCQILETATSCADGTNSFAVTGSASGSSTAGDDLVFQAAPTNTPTAANAWMAVRFRATEPGAFGFIIAPSIVSTTLTEYYPLTGSSGTGSTTEALMQNISDSMTLKQISVKLAVAPGAGKSRAFTLRINGADTGLTCTVADTNTACAFATDVTVVANDLLSLSIVPSGTPASAASHVISLLAVR